MNERKRVKFYFERGEKPACSPARWQAGEVQDKIFRLQPFEAPVEQVY
jgi:hypothetical protein